MISIADVLFKYDIFVMQYLQHVLSRKFACNVCDSVNF